MRHAGVAQAAVIAREDGPGGKRLVGYVVAAAGCGADAAALRAHLGRSLPELHGAVCVRGSGSSSADAERQARPSRAAGAGGARGERCGAVPRTPQEEILCALFAEVLGLERVGIDDNFFALGGDSIMSIQLVSRARQAGLVITPRAVFQHQTVAALAGVVGACCSRRRSALLDIATGALPATPIMHWLLERGGPIERFNQAMLLQVPAGLQRRSSVRRAAGRARSSRCVAAAADRMRRRRGAWRWRRPARWLPADCLRRIDIRGLDDAGLRACIAEAGAGGRAPACPCGRGDAAGGVVRRRRAGVRPSAADDPSSRGGRGVVAHPGAGACGGVGGDCARRQPALAPRGTSFRGWAQRLASHAHETGGASRSFRSGAGCWVRRRCRWSRVRSILRATSTARPGISR